MRPIVLFLTVWLPASAGAMELGGIPTPATRMQRGVTCTPVPGVGRCTEGATIAPPAGLGWDPGLAVTCTGGRPTTKFDVATLAPTGKRYYVGYAGASDTKDGLTPATSFASVIKALSMPDVGEVWLFPKLYLRNQGTFPLGTNGRSVSIKADGGRAIISAHDSLTWTQYAPGAYQAARSAIGSVWDARFSSPDGDYQQLQTRPTPADVAEEPGTWAADASTVYVRTSDSRAPDSDVRVYLNVKNGYATGAVTVYLENIDFEGGNYGFQAVAANASERPTVYAKGCSFKYSHTADAFVIRGADTICQNCLAAQAFLDGFNYHENAGIKSRNVEIDCVGRDNGWEGGNSNNGSTTHDGMTVVRIGGSYYRNRGPQVADVNGAKTWNAGVAAFGSIGAVNTNTNFHTEGTMWCDQCSSRASTWDLRVVQAGSVANLRRFTERGRRLNDSSTTVACY